MGWIELRDQKTEDQPVRTTVYRTGKRISGWVGSKGVSGDGPS